MNSDMTKTMTIRWIIDAFRRTLLHYGLWFNETERQLGLETALRAEREAGDRLLRLALERLAGVLRFELRDGLPASLWSLPPEQLEQLLDASCVNWLAADGVWFQAVEALATMHDAKRANDTCWTRFSPYEAARIRELLELPEPGQAQRPLDVLKTALSYRLYARVNRQEIVDDGPDAFIFRMLNCRVQHARKRKQLEDYPCKSGGVVEYRCFARAIDPRIEVECLSCPPDPHPDDWYCAWRFSVSSG